MQRYLDRDNIFFSIFIRALIYGCDVKVSSIYGLPGQMGIKLKLEKTWIKE